MFIVFALRSAVAAALGALAGIAVALWSGLGAIIGSAAALWLTARSCCVLTTPAVAALLEREVDVVFFSRGFRYRGRLMTTGSKFAELRVAQLKVMSDEDESLALARSIAGGKLANQRALLQRRLREGEADLGVARGALEVAVAGIGQMAEGAARAESLESLRGYEGKAGAYYFGALKALLDPAWGFTGRQYYPAPDPVNAVLSFGYMLLLKDMTAAVQLVGLDPYLGFFHVIDYGRPSLSLDIMEEFRPILVDTLVLGMIARGQLTPADFVRTGRERRPVEMAPGGVERFLKAYEERLEVRIMHPVAGQRSSYRRCLELQARQVAGVVLGKAEAYVPVAIR